MSIRTERIGEQIRESLSRLLRDDISDPRVGMLSLTRVEAAPDLSTAVVHWSPLGGQGEEVVDRAAAGLASAAAFLRRRLAAELTLRRTPELIFRHDPSIEQGAGMLSLLNDLEREREAKGHAESEREGRGADGEEA